MGHGAQAATEEKTKTPAKREADDESSLDEDDDELPEDALEEEASDYDEDQVYEGGKKRKRRAVSPGAFGEALEQLLGVGDTQRSEEQPEARDGILSLAPGIRKTANASTMRAKAARLMLEQRRQREERAHIKDVIGEWGPPGVQTSSGPVYTEAMDVWLQQGGTKGYERRLRKTAQRGGTCASLTIVVKLFNAIRAAQTTTEEDIDKARSMQTTKQARKVNALGNKELAVKQLSKTHFLELLRQAPKSTQAEPNS